jgi:hypothetical protein
MDPAVTSLAEQGDVRPDPGWDVIFLDAFTMGGRLPFHLMTREFLEEVRAHLAPGGIVVANLNSALAGPAGRIFRSEYVTYRAVFSELYVFPRFYYPEAAKATDGWWEEPRNIFLLATLGGERLAPRELIARAQGLWGETGKDEELEALFYHACNHVSRESVEAWFDAERRAGAPIDFGDAVLLTDDYAPVDTMVFERPEEQEE